MNTKNTEYKLKNFVVDLVDSQSLNTKKTCLFSFIADCKSTINRKHMYHIQNFKSHIFIKDKLPRGASYNHGSLQVPLGWSNRTIHPYDLLGSGYKFSYLDIMRCDI